MRTYYDKRSIARLFLKRIGLAGLFLLVIIAILGVWNAYQKERESAGLRAEAEGQHADLVARATQMQDNLARLNTDRGKEEALRTQYAMAEKGEKLIVIVDPSTTTPIHATSTSAGDWFRKTFWPW